MLGGVGDVDGQADGAAQTDLSGDLVIGRALPSLVTPGTFIGM